MTMNADQSLNQLADNYRAQGYSVVVHPQADDLPDFAKDFKVEIVATRNGGGVLASAKKNHAELAADREIPRYAEMIGKRPGWRFDVIVMGAESHPALEERDAHEPSEDDIRRDLEEVERILKAGFVKQALIAGWATLESVMRRRLRADGEAAGWGSSPRTMLNELYSDGILEGSVFRDLERLLQARNAVVHGFATAEIDDSAVQFLIDTAQTLLDSMPATSDSV
jgi:hypothetical protein